MQGAIHASLTLPDCNIITCYQGTSTQYDTVADLHGDEFRFNIRSPKLNHNMGPFFHLNEYQSIKMCFS